MPNNEFQEVSNLAIGINNFTIKDASARAIISEIINAIGANNDNIAERINDLHNRSFDAEIKISSQNETEISNIVDGLYKLQYVTITGEGTEATETLNNSAILIQKETNQYLYKDGQILSRTKTNNTWGTWESNIPVQVQSDWNETATTSPAYINNKPYIPIDYSRQYLTFEALEDGTFQFTNAISYSIDNGTTWVSLAADTNTPTVTSGNKIMWKGELTPNLINGIGTFSSTGNFNVEGNAMSLLFGDNFIGQTDLTGKDYAFRKLFSYCSKLINAENLILLATTLAINCYMGMFSGCTNLVNAPALPANTLAEYCYGSMFSGCTNLVNVPKLPATTLARYCYSSMFSGCTSLITVPELPATTLSPYCYEYMFDGCTGLITVHELPATTLASGCYNGMFVRCTNLVNAPALPATTLASSCYNSMFSGCTSLVTAPELPATTLASGCYSCMFKDCTSLITAPELPATTLISYCHTRMFEGCTSLNYIKAMFTTTPSNGYTANWVAGVSATGTFVKNNNAQWDVTGSNGVPTGWTVYTEDEYEFVRHHELANINSGDSNIIEIIKINGATLTPDSNKTINIGVKTVNNESLVGTGNIVVSGLPQVSASDNGKVLMVINGQWQVVSPSVLYSGNGVPNNTQGNNGDLYIQTD